MDYVSSTERLVAAWWRAKEMPPGAFPAPGGVVWGDAKKQWGWRPNHRPWTDNSEPVRLTWGPKILFAGVWHPGEQVMEWQTEPPLWADTRPSTRITANRAASELFGVHRLLLHRVAASTIISRGTETHEDGMSAAMQAFAETLAKFASDKRPNCTWAQAIWMRTRQVAGRDNQYLIRMPERVKFAALALRTVPSSHARNPQSAFEWLCRHRSKTPQDARKAIESGKLGTIEKRWMVSAFEFPQVVFAQQHEGDEGILWDGGLEVWEPDPGAVEEGVTALMYAHMSAEYQADV